MGITLERKFSVDISLDDNSVLRLMKNRTDINLIVLDNGRLAKKNGEIVLEKRYCEEHDHSIGDKIKIAIPILRSSGSEQLPTTICLLQIFPIWQWRVSFSERRS